jgi:hypothetical protein
MSTSSRPKKIKPKGFVREYKVVHTVNRHGEDTIKAEEVKEPRRGSKKGNPTKEKSTSRSPTKRPKLDFEAEQDILLDFEGKVLFPKRQTLVGLSKHLPKTSAK